MVSTRCRFERGFTLIELIVVIVIIGLLATVVTGRFSDARGNAFVSLMKSDLHNLAIAEESYFYDNGTSASGLEDLGNAFTASAGIDITIAEATNAGWSATTTDTGTAVKCYLFIEGAAPLGSASTNGSSSCT